MPGELDITTNCGLLEGGGTPTGARRGVTKRKHAADPYYVFGKSGP